MARITVRVSDLSGNQIPDDESGARLIVEHPDYPEPVGLDVLPDDVLPHLDEENSRFVVVSVLRADDQTPPRYVLSMPDFENLFQTGESSSVLQEAFETQQQEQERPKHGRGRRGASELPRPRVD